MVVPSVAKGLVDQPVEGGRIAFRGVGEPDPMLTQGAQAKPSTGGRDQGLDLGLESPDRELGTSGEKDLDLLRPLSPGAVDQILGNPVHAARLAGVTPAWRPVVRRRCPPPLARLSGWWAAPPRPAPSVLPCRSSPARA